MKAKLHVAILMGGKSTEHEISMISARNIVENINRNLYTPILIGIDENGKWLRIDEEDFKNKPELFKTLPSDTMTQGLAITPGRQDQQFYDLDRDSALPMIDVAFPVLHGAYGEDGAVQGVLKLLNIPFVGPSVAGSAINMDKEIMKKILKEAKIKSAKYLCFHYLDRNKIKWENLTKKLGTPIILKPASCGSSVGVHKLKSAEDLQPALDDAFQYDNKILFEECIVGKEVEVAVMGNHKTKATLPGEVITNSKYELYDYQAKYLDPKGAEIVIPAQIDTALAQKVKKHSIKSYKALFCEGLSRVDSFVQADGSILLNEINTLPGFTSISMFPKLWAHEGIAYAKLITILLDYALERSKMENRLSTDYISS